MDKIKVTKNYNDVISFVFKKIKDFKDREQIKFSKKGEEEIVLMKKNNLQALALVKSLSSLIKEFNLPIETIGFFQTYFFTIEELDSFINSEKTIDFIKKEIENPELEIKRIKDKVEEIKNFINIYSESKENIKDYFT
jgi:hypothetical protein